MAKAKSAIAVIVILVLLQVSWATGRKYEPGLQPHHKDVVMTVFPFSEENGAGSAIGCDSNYHTDHELIVALPRKWYAKGRRCNKMIRITSNDTGATVVAKVVDECYLCDNNVVGSSPAVWKQLGLQTNTHSGKACITWSDA